MHSKLLTASALTGVALSLALATKAVFTPETQVSPCKTIPVGVDGEFVSDDVTYVYAKTSKELTLLARPTTGITIGYRSNKAAYTTCSGPDGMRVAVHVQPTIYIASDFNTGACGRAILAHEEHHVAIDRMVMEKHNIFLQAEMMSAIDLKTSQADIKEKVDAIVRRQIDFTAMEIDLKNAQFDSPEEYAYYRICESETAKLAMK